MRHLILTVAGFGDYKGVELAAVRLDVDTLAWLRSLLARPWPAGLRSARLADFPDAIEFLTRPADRDAAIALSARLADEDRLVIEDAERQTLRPFDGGVDLSDVEVLIDGTGAATDIRLIAGIEFRGGYVEGFTRLELTLDPLRAAEAIDAGKLGVASCSTRACRARRCCSCGFGARSSGSTARSSPTPAGSRRPSTNTFRG